MGAGGGGEMMQKFWAKQQLKELIGMCRLGQVGSHRLKAQSKSSRGFSAPKVEMATAARLFAAELDWMGAQLTGLAWQVLKYLSGEQKVS